MNSEQEEKFETAISVIANVLKKDKMMYLSWQSTIAMLIYDECVIYKKKNKKKTLSNVDLHTCANAGAMNFLNLLIK